MRILKLIIILYFTSGLLMTAVTFGEEHDYVLTFQFENDYFGGGTDRHFTHGTRIEYYTGAIPLITRWADKLPWFDSRRESGRADDALEGRATISLGQNIYTPDNTYSSDPVIGERPYAGWLYAGFGLMANQGARRYDKVLLEIGVVGPASFARDVQKIVHSMFDRHMPEGWENQLKNELGIVLYYERAYRLTSPKSVFTFEYDVVPNFGGSIGNVYTYGSAGLTARVGRRLEKDFGAPRIQPALPGGGYFSGTRKVWFIFAGVQGRLIYKNIFLDGNTFRDSLSVEKNHFVGDLQIGFSVRWKRVRMSYTQIMRTKEYKGQESADIFGSLSLSFQF